jgi:hypothetical protein
MARIVWDYFSMCKFIGEGKARKRGWCGVHLIENDTHTPKKKKKKVGLSQPKLGRQEKIKNK